jgi:hypothetical protein
MNLEPGKEDQQEPPTNHNHIKTYQKTLQDCLYSCSYAWK